MRMPSWIHKIPLIRSLWGISDEELEALKRDFRIRYNAFKLLIAENQKSLNLITEMEVALRGDAPFDMSFVRSRCNDAVESVSEIVKQLNEIAPNKYEELFEQLNKLNSNINSFVSAKLQRKDVPLIRLLEELDSSLADQTGSKMATLGELRSRLDLKIPIGFVVTAEAYRQFMEFNKIQPEIDRLIQSGAKDSIEQLNDLSEGINQFIIGCPIPKVLKEAIEWQYSKLEETQGNNVSVAMRSSALGEDGPEMSFAGQYRTVFNVTRENITLAYKEVLASKYQIQAMMYRLNRGIRDEDVAMCVGCMPLVDSRSGGVAYTGNPLDTSDKDVVILSVWGHPKPVVDGREATDLFVVSRKRPREIVRKIVPNKKHEYVYNDEEGIYPVELTEDKGKAASLSDEMILELTQSVLKIEKYYGVAQDVEWVVDNDGILHILQSRQLTQQESNSLPHEANFDETLSSSIILDGGITASPGAAAGPVCIVNKEKDALAFPDGGVLVASQSLPYWAMLLNRASAVVTQQGSVAGHLANVAREFNVPAIFGLKHATQKLKNQQMVTVDADMRTIYDGKKDVLLNRTIKKNIEIQGSPTYDALKNAAQHIVPLRLLDPDSPDFKPKNCTTLHDITRFCHEKSVKEMFENRTDHRLQKHNSKQLYCDVPMQYWIVDLEDGLKEGAENDRYARFENIVSIPMLALWKGMNALPWKGPPPIDAGGLASVFVGSTTDPSLDPSMPSVYSTRNYFMISKNFCSLQSRVGYHFATVEALVGRNSEENYLRFQFKGGGANLERKIARANLISGVLENKKFRVVVNQDSVFAGIENYEQPFMESRLEILGHIIIHTRQLDMVMNNQANIDNYKQKIMKDLERL